MTFKETITTRYPFSSTPRQVAFPERIDCMGTPQFFTWLNKYNGIKRKMYYSIYRTNDLGNFDDVIIDSIAFDLDSDKKIENIRKLFEYCEKNNYKSMFVFSTNGFWAFIKTTAVKLKNPKIALGEAQRKVCADLGFKIAKGKDGDVDESIVGDIARITRAINTRDIGRNRFCIVLRKNELYKNFEEICTIASKQRLEYYIYGEKLLDLTPFDSDKPTYQKTDSTAPLLIDPNIQMKADIKDFLPCVQSWLTIREMGTYKARFFFSVYCAQTAITPTECDRLAREYFGKMPRTDNLPNNYEHFKRLKVIQRAYKEDKNFPSCDYLLANGFCKKKCEKYCGTNSPIYFKGGQ